MQPGFVPRVGVAARLLVDGQAVVHVVPVVRRRIRRINAKRLHSIDRLQDFLDLWPSGEAQQNLPTRTHIRHGRAALAWLYCAQNIDARENCAVVVRCPANEGKDAARRERDDAPVAVEDRLLSDPAEADPILDALLYLQEFDLSQITHARLLRHSGGCACARSCGAPAVAIPIRP